MYQRVPAPNHFKRDPYPKYQVKKCDYHVATNGNDQGDGSEMLPFATLKKACEVASLYKSDAIIGIHEGKYYWSSLKLDGRNSGVTIRRYGDGPVTICGGYQLTLDATIDIPADYRKRIPQQALPHVLCYDLKYLGLSADDWGPVYPIGSFNTSGKYDGDYDGKNCEVFCNNQRLKPARYPNSGFLHLDDVMDVGDVREYPSQNYFYDWDTRRNHRGGTYIMDRDTAKRAGKWQEPEKAWMFGYFMWDWADSSTPVKALNADVRTVSPLFVSMYGAKKGADYFFYNILEELDAPGEWYLDREKGLLFVWPTDESKEAEIEISISNKPNIEIIGGADITIEGLTFSCTRSDGVRITGKNNTVSQCIFKNILDNAVVVSGENNKVTMCEITHTGRGGIMLSGGDRNTLTPGNNIASYNLIHDWSEVYLTYQAAVCLSGCGNTASHNEIFNSPQLAILYSGNDHLIEYNVIHDVVLQSTDGGAIYAGRDWTAYGTVIKYNVLWNIGQGSFRPDGIYWDDALSGQTAVGNLLINVSKFSFLAGGGRDNSIIDNVIINPGEHGIYYDNRARDGFLNAGWFRATCEQLWAPLALLPIHSEVWKKKYPHLDRMNRDLSGNPEEPDFPVNPSYAYITGNRIFDRTENFGRLDEGVEKFGFVDHNETYSLQEIDRYFESPSDGDYHFKDHSDLPAIPLDKVGIRF